MIFFKATSGLCNLLRKMIENSLTDHILQVRLIGRFYCVLCSLSEQAFKHTLTCWNCSSFFKKMSRFNFFANINKIVFLFLDFLVPLQCNIEVVWFVIFWIFIFFFAKPGTFFKHITNFTTNMYVKNVHPVYGAGIRTHNLWNNSLLS